MSIVQRALIYLGVTEATGHNDGAPAELFNQGEAKSWCASFVATVFALEGHPLPGKRRMLPSVRYMRTQLEANGAFHPVAEITAGFFVPEAGDILFFNWRVDSDPATGSSGDHVEIVISYDPKKRRFETIGGNVRNAVRRQYRSLTGVTGAARWKGAA